MAAFAKQYSKAHSPFPIFLSYCATSASGPLKDMGMEAIYEFEVKDIPVTVAVDATGESVHHSGPLVWREKIRKKGLLVG